VLVRSVETCHLSHAARGYFSEIATAWERFSIGGVSGSCSRALQNAYPAVLPTPDRDGMENDPAKTP